MKLGGGLDAPIEKFPDYMQAKAGRSTTPSAISATPTSRRRSPASRRRSPISSSAASRRPARPVFAVVADTGLWVDANPKESDLTYVMPGLPATVTVDTFPGREWKGTVCSIAPGTGAQFAILPPQNASGNWVKVVQRMPLRFCFDADQDTTGLRAGMSADVSIDTGRVALAAGPARTRSRLGRARRVAPATRRTPATMNDSPPKDRAVRARRC